MVSGAVVKYHNCAVEEILPITENGNLLQCKDLWESCCGQFSRVPDEYEDDAIEELEITDSINAVYTFGNAFRPHLIAFASDIVSNPLDVYNQRIQRLQRLFSLYEEFRANVNADIARCRAEIIAVCDDVEEWESADITMLEHISHDLDFHFKECEQWLKSHVRYWEND